MSARSVTAAAACAVTICGERTVAELGIRPLVSRRWVSECNLDLLDPDLAAKLQAKIDAAGRQ
jgi:hypothetical protein